MSSGELGDKNFEPRRNFSLCVIIQNMTDLSKILKKHKTGWLALTPDNKELVAKGKTLKELLTCAKKKGVDKPTVFKTASIDNYFIG